MNTTIRTYELATYRDGSRRPVTLAAGAAAPACYAPAIAAMIAAGERADYLHDEADRQIAGWLRGH